MTGFLYDKILLGLVQNEHPSTYLATGYPSYGL